MEGQCDGFGGKAYDDPVGRVIAGEVLEIRNPTCARDGTGGGMSLHFSSNYAGVGFISIKAFGSFFLWISKK